MHFPPARQRLHQITRQSDTFSLAEAALYIAQEQYPELAIAPYLNRLDQLAAQVQRPEVDYPLKVIQAINQVLFTEIGFQGNQQDYYDPRNSYLNEVLDRRLGIPITLSLVYLEVAARLNLPMEGVNFPGHFLIRPLGDSIDIFVDPFHGGEILFREDCRERLAALYQRPIDLQPTFFQSIAPRGFLQRMLTNLKHIFFQRGDFSQALAASERILLVNPQASLEKRDRGLLYFQLQRWTAARQDLEDYLQEHPTASDRSVISRLLDNMN